MSRPNTIKTYSLPPAAALQTSGDRAIRLTLAK